MTHQASLLALLLAFSLAGCATFTDAELAQFRQQGLRPALIAKLDREQPLAPGEFIELKRAGISDALVLRHLDRVGIDYVVTSADVARLRKAGVRPAIIDALLHESDRFASEHVFRAYGSPYFYGDPWDPAFYGDWAFGVGAGF